MYHKCVLICIGSHFQELTGIKMAFKNRAIRKTDYFGPIKYPTHLLHGSPLYFPGDLRVNEQPTLGAIHLLWVREHNRIARELKKINGHWNDERLFQVTNYD